ncbi:MAG: GtrA family protein [Pseudomonadota bacterium]
MINLQNIIRLYTSPQFFRFLLVGGVALGLHWAARLLFDIWTTYTTAIVLAYGVGMASAYALNRVLVFPLSGNPMRIEIAYFFGVNIASFPFVWGAAEVLGRYVFTVLLEADFARAAGHAVAITLPVFVNFAAHKFLTFREQG